MEGGMKYFMTMVCVLFLGVIHAEEILPPGCRAQAIKNETISITGPAMIMVHNLSDADIWLTHDTFTHLNSHIEKGQWSALSLDKESIEFNCVESRPGHEQQVSCKELVALCQWPSIRPEKLKGSLWAGENRSLNALMAFVERQGFELQAKNNS